MHEIATVISGVATLASGGFTGPVGALTVYISMDSRVTAALMQDWVCMGLRTDNLSEAVKFASTEKLKRAVDF